MPPAASNTITAAVPKTVAKKLSEVGDRVPLPVSGGEGASSGTTTWAVSSPDVAETVTEPVPAISVNTACPCEFVVADAGLIDAPVPATVALTTAPATGEPLPHTKLSI